MKKAKYILSALLLVTVFIQPAVAQFEGKITYNSYEYSSEGSEEKQDEFTMFITPERILLQGEKKYDFVGSIQTEGVLVRMDFEDFVFLTGENKALKISKTDITSLMKMFENEQNISKDMADKGEDITFERTGEQTTIQGYNSEKFIFQNKDNTNEYSEVWMTKDMQVNWGMLSEPWSGSAEEMISSFPTSLIFQEKYFPVKMDFYRNDKMISKIEATDISETPVAKAMVQVPSGVQVLSFQDYLFQKMSQQ